MTPDPIDRLILTLLDRPPLAAGAVIALLVVVAFSVLVVQELVVAVWFFVLVFLIYLAWRFVRAFERLAGAVDRYLDDRTEE